ncbi:MAG: HAMP domain-containing sensor histidine kinase [Candidatus Zixiibacteriota bacterium]
MARRSNKSPIKFAFIVFIGLMIFCIIQMTWWIVFHIGEVKEKAELEKQIAMLQSDDGSLPIEKAEEINRRQDRMIFMLVSESSFFVLIILIGAFQIYRTLKQSEELKRRQLNFIHAVTHEFRTPITSLRLYLETLESAKLDEKKKAELYPKMIDDANRLEHLVDNVLQAGLFDQDGYHLNLTESEISRDIEEYLKSHKPYLDRHGVNIETDISQNILVKTDHKSLERVLDSLIDNAIKYSPNEKNISVRLHEDNQSAVLIIADLGVGISQSEQKKIFERFYRVGDENTRTVNGTGLGLYLAKEIIEAHGGSITVHSDGINKGTAFEIRLPRINHG